MFLKRRALQAEYFDEHDRPLPELEEGYRYLGFFNQLFFLSRLFKILLPNSLGESNCRNLSILDLGAGDGSLDRDLSTWARRRGWNWRITSLELDERALRLNRGGSPVAGSALALPFRDQTFDVVIAAQMTHHFPSDREVLSHFKEAWRVTRKGLFFTDLHRNRAFYLALATILDITRVPPHFREDALLSVKRGWRVKEWQSLAGNANIPDPKVWLYAGTRIMLEAHRKY